MHCFLYFPAPTNGFVHLPCLLRILLSLNGSMYLPCLTVFAAYPHLPRLLFSFSMLDIDSWFHLMSLCTYPCLDVFATYPCLLRFLLSLNSLACSHVLLCFATYPQLSGLLL